MKKGFVITFDAIAALIFLFIAGMIMANQIFYPTTPRGVYLKQISLDVLTVLDKTDRLDSFVDENSTSIREILVATPDSVCMQITINDLTEDLAVMNKPNCGSYGKELQTAARMFVYNDDVYFAKIESWYKKD